MARYFGNVAQLYVDTAGAPTVGVGTKVGDIRDTSFPSTPIKADRSSNDTGVRGAHGVPRVEGDLKFKVAAVNRSDAGMAKLIASMPDKGGDGMVYFEFHPEGTGSGKPKASGYGSVELSVTESYDQYASADVTISPSGAVTWGTQA
jgi:hypothetical protein